MEISWGAFFIAHGAGAIVAKIFRLGISGILGHIGRCWSGAGRAPPGVVARNGSRSWAVLWGGPSDGKSEGP